MTRRIGRRTIPEAAGLAAAATLLAAHFAASVHAQDFSPNIELQSSAITPGVTFAECDRPVHQVRLFVDDDATRGRLVLDPNIPTFDDFGALNGGVVTPQSGGARGALPAVQQDCVIEPVRTGSDGWRLFQLRGPELKSSLWVAAKGSLLDGGPARLLIRGNDDRVHTVIPMTRYGLVVP